MDKQPEHVKRTAKQAIMRMPQRRGGRRDVIGGRPVKLDADLLGAMVDGLERGLTVEEMAERCAIHPRSFYAWRRQGHQRPDSIFGELVRRTDAIRAERHAAEQQRLEEQRRQAPPKLPGAKRTRRDPQTLLIARTFELMERHQRQQQHAAVKAGVDTETTTDAPQRETTKAEREAAADARLRVILDTWWQEQQSFLATLATQRATLLDLRERFWGTGDYGSESTHDAGDDRHQEQQRVTVTRKRQGRGTS